MDGQLNTSLPLKKSFFASFLSIAARWGWVIFAIELLQTYGEQVLSQHMQDELASKEGISLWMVFYAGTSILSSLIFPSMVLLLCAYAYQNRKATWVSDFNQVLIETLRSWGSALSWSFLLIVPGVIQLVRLSFAPVVVLFSKKYQAGEVDALEESRLLAKGAYGKLLLLYSVMSLFVPYLLSGFDKYEFLARTPGPALGLNLVQSFFSIVFCLWIFDIYEKQAVKYFRPNITEVAL